METRTYSKKSHHKPREDGHSSHGKNPKIVSSGRPKEKEVYVAKNTKIEPHLHSLRKYSNYEWDNQDINTLYNDFKEIEKHLKTMLETDYKQCLHVVSDYASLRDYFLTAWEKIISKDADFACKKEIDKRLWQILKKPIEAMSKGKKKDESEKENLVKVIDDNVAIIKDNIQKISAKLDIQNTPITEDAVARKMSSNLISYLGELLQIKEKANTSRPTLAVPVELYFRASSIYPYEGKYFMLISNCSKVKEDLFGAIYWGMRAYCCMNFYPMNEQLLKYLEEARLAYLEMLEKEWLEPRNVELFKYFILSYLRYLNIILTKIGFEELNGVSNKMFEYLQKYITYLINDHAKLNKVNEGSLLQQTVMLMIYSLYHSIQGYNPKDDSREKYLEPQGKTFEDLTNSDLAKETLKYSFGIIHHILDLILGVNEENYLNVISPLLYYMKEHKSESNYLLSAYKQLKDKFIAVNKKLSELYKEKCEETKTSDEEITTLLAEHSFANDKLLFGFIPLMPYFWNHKTSSKKMMPQDKQYLAKIKDTINMLDTLGCKVKEVDHTKEKSDVFNLDKLVGSALEGDVKNQVSNFGDMALNKENKEKNLIVLDAQNVAIRYGDTRFKSMGLKIAIDYWVEKGHQVQFLLPDYYFKKEEVATKRQLAQSKGESLKHIPDDVDMLCDLKAKGFAFGVPNWNYDDSFIIDHAKRKNGYIVTNDRYNDHIENYSKGDPQLKKKLKDWMRNNCISFTFIGDDFLPNPDFLNEHMK